MSDSETSKNNVEKYLRKLSINKTLVPKEVNELLINAKNLGISITWHNRRSTRGNPGGSSFDNNNQDTGGQEQYHTGEEGNGEEQENTTDPPSPPPETSNQSHQIPIEQQLNYDWLTRILHELSDTLNATEYFDIPKFESTPHNSTHRKEKTELTLSTIHSERDSDSTSFITIPEFFFFSEPYIFYFADNFFIPEFLYTMDPPTHATVTMDPGKFSGKIDEDVDEFIIRFERACKVNGWDTSDKKARYFPCYLTGTALTWLGNFEAANDGPVGYITLRDALRHGYTPKTPEDRADTLLRTRMQTKGETVDNYFHDIIHLCRLANPDMTESVKARHIMHGLNKAIVKSILVLKNDTPEEVLANARKAEMAQSYGEDETNSFLLKQSADTMTKLAEQMENLTKISNQNGNYNKYRGNRPFYKQNFSRGSFYQSYPRDQTQRQINSQDVRFQQQVGPSRGNFNQRPGRGRGNFSHNIIPNNNIFNRSGHSNDRNTRNPDGRVRCFKCSKIGHYASSCRSTNPSTGNNGNSSRQQQPGNSQRQ